MVKPLYFYLCDQQKCKNCSYPECKHTSDLDHAKNKDKPISNLKFMNLDSYDEYQYWEIEDTQKQHRL